MFNSMLLLSFTGHILGDYYLQTDKTAYNKNERFSKLLYHAGIYILPFVILFLIFGRTYRLGIYFLTICTAHFAIDLIKFIIYKSGLFRSSSKKYKTKDLLIYITDQSLHIISILFISIYFKIPSSIIQLVPVLKDFLKAINLDMVSALKWILLVLCIYRPTNVTFVKAFSHYKPEIREESPNIVPARNAAINKKAGSVIGLLERVLIVIFINIQQYSAIGLILTAKSIARYDSISKSQDFAEYYLIGTLTSLLSAILFYLAVFGHL
ncbi:MAG: DUF3307 domain-containing protein [Clostridiaceae bacterium]